VKVDECFAARPTWPVVIAEDGVQFSFALCDHVNCAGSIFVVHSVLKTITARSVIWQFFSSFQNSADFLLA
jgi:hypothetical protein